MTQIWLAVNEEGNEYAYEKELLAETGYWYLDEADKILGYHINWISLPKGCIEKLIGHKLIPSDGAVMLED